MEVSNLAIFIYSRLLRMLGWLVAQVNVRVKYVILWNQYTAQNYLGEANVYLVNSINGHLEFWQLLHLDLTKCWRKPSESTTAIQGKYSHLQ
jgi:hypothetical protein